MKKRERKKFKRMVFEGRLAESQMLFVCFPVSSFVLGITNNFAEIYELVYGRNMLLC